MFFRKIKNSFILILIKMNIILKNLKLNTNIELENLECAIACCLALNLNEKK